MTTPLGTVFSTDKKTIVQADLRLFVSTIESLVVEFDQVKSNSFSPQAPLAPNQHCSTAKFLRRLALRSLQRLLKEKVFWKLSVRFLTKLTVQPLLRFWQPPVETTRLMMESLRRPARSVSWLTAKTAAKTNLAATLLSRICKLSSQGVRNNPCEPIEWWSSMMASRSPSVSRSNWSWRQCYWH